MKVVAHKDEMEQMEENISTQEEVSEGAEPASEGVSEAEPVALAEAQAAAPAESAGTPAVSHLRRRQEKVGLVTSDKMQKTVTVRVERQVRHPKYRRYIRRRSKFLAHDELGAHTGDIVRIVETRPLSARKRWRVVEIVQRAS
ncbi:MAG TPA: 30S ribosomal protein S17 [Blastocatellia bacterium]